MPAPCNFDHNGECLVCDAWPSDCAWQRLIERNFKHDTEKKLVEMFWPHMSDEEKIKYAIVMGKVYAPFTDEQVEKLKQWQSGDGWYYEPDKNDVLNFKLPPHPFTCCGHDGCTRPEELDDGILIPTTEGWVCPCGKWKQNWCHDFMVK